MAGASLEPCYGAAARSRSDSFRTPILGTFDPPSSVGGLSSPPIQSMSVACGTPSLDRGDLDVHPAILAVVFAVEAIRIQEHPGVRGVVDLVGAVAPHQRAGRLTRHGTVRLGDGRAGQVW